MDAIMSMIIDDGFASRGHRNNIFSKEFNVLFYFDKIIFIKRMLELALIDINHLVL